MDITDFIAGHFVRNGSYTAFNPSKINTVYTWNDAALNLQLEQAVHKLGELSAFSELVPDIDYFIRLYVMKEALISSQIEGTQTNMQEMLQSEKAIAPERRNDWREVNNYITALNSAIKGLQKLPLSSRLLKEAHEILLQNVRGEHKLPGQFRKSQNWIGGAGINDARFVPPPAGEVETLMGDLENLIHNPDCGLPHVLRVALAHYQFETIHPFLDGNGRIGRLMITLYFVQFGILKKPALYLSDFFNKNKALYYENLMLVRTKNDLVHWFRFFLTGIIETASLAINGLKEIIALKKVCEEEHMVKLGKKIPAGRALLSYLFINPIVYAETVSQVTGLSKVSAYKLIADFVRLQILKEMTGFKRNRIFVFDAYFKIFDQASVN